MAGTLARGFGLNVPEFEIAYVPRELVDLHPEGNDLGCGPVFASRVAQNPNEILFTQANRVPRSTRRDVIAFDWWIRNADRTLTATGGNPNLLWDANVRELIVIDHNQAFDTEFNCEDFLSTHIFQAEFPGLCADLALMGNYAARMKSTLELWDHAWEAVPSEWHFKDEEQTVPVNFDPIACTALLARCETEELWRLP
ncbi:hypothetical protein KIP65_21565 [Xanthomonas campestris pv. campestris]|nr:hypothetical protein [Xanthomonas campestris pv. campestris]MCF8812164.1 hypothetical protein [Xanthomonas campestris pv. campestris]RFF48846.1 hypothetical protein D0A42_06185 [Xanthomonas campestris pv. campestris]RFF76042.1 hypothetical protein DZE36_04750 [Xanthomonas campestris pv. campestris]